MSKWRLLGQIRGAIGIGDGVDHASLLMHELLEDHEHRLEHLERQSQEQPEPWKTEGPARCGYLVSKPVRCVGPAEHEGDHSPYYYTSGKPTIPWPEQPDVAHGPSFGITDTGEDVTPADALQKLRNALPIPEQPEQEQCPKCNIVFDKGSMRCSTEGCPVTSEQPEGGEQQERCVTKIGYLNQMVYCELPRGHTQNHLGPMKHGSFQWPDDELLATRPASTPVSPESEECEQAAAFLLVALEGIGVAENWKPGSERWQTVVTAYGAVKNALSRRPAQEKQ